jgi:transcriptional regulator with XRE-family HTH domain
MSISTLLANLRGTLKSDVALRETDLFKTMKVAGFDPAHPVKIRRSDKLLICGYHRTRCAEILKIAPKIEYVDCTDEEALQMAVRDNIYTAPVTMERRKAIAIELFQQHNWTQQVIADRLDVAQRTVSEWLRHLAAPLNVARPSKTDKLGRKASTGRPKGIKTTPSKVPAAQRQRIAEKVLDEGKTWKETLAEEGVSATVLRGATAYERGRRDAKTEILRRQAEAREVEERKAEHGMIKHLRETVGRQSRHISALEKKIKELEARELPEITPEEKKELTAYRRKIRHELHTEYKSRIAHNDARLAEARRIYGCMQQPEFNAILKAVRRDTTASEETMREAQETMLRLKDVLLGQPAPVKQNGRAQTPIRR